MSVESSYLALQEFVISAKERLPQELWDYIIGGTETETTMRRNRLDLDSIALRPRVLNDVSQVKTDTTLMGRSARLPVVLCPIGGLEAFHDEGVQGVAKAATRFGVPMFLSGVTEQPMEAFVENNGPELTLVYQLYARTAFSGIHSLLERSAASNLPAFCVTVDSANYSRRERDIVSRFVKPWRAQVQDDAWHYQASLNWNDIRQIRENYAGQLILKGIATAEDALIAIDHGVDIIYVSNHGGRQLDHAIGSTSSLREIVAATNGQARLYVDGGYCRGTDIAKAIALGADAVGLGRMMCLALAAAGGDGVYRMLEILEQEYRIALALLGVTSAKALNEKYLCSVEPTQADHPLRSAFPLLDDLTF